MRLAATRGGRSCARAVVAFGAALVVGSVALCAVAGARPADCKPVEARPCEDCFAVFVMPDIQNYTSRRNQPHGAAHLDMVTRYICSHRDRWQEPSTGKTMPIAMVIQLGDLVSNADVRDPAGQLEEWIRADAAFDNLDRCKPAVPYLVTMGNHDLPKASYESVSEGFNEYFGPDRWARYQCTDPAKCDWDSGEWFIGGGDPIARDSRVGRQTRKRGPSKQQPGRHRAAVIRAPGGQPYLFMGLELAFDFPPAAPGAEGVEGDDSRWPKQVLRDYADVPAIVFHHSLFWPYGQGDTRVRFGPERWGSASLRARFGPKLGEGAMKDLWDEIVAPHPQVFMAFSGHVLKPSRQGDFVVPRPSAPPVFGFLRNYQDVRVSGDRDPTRGYGVGWNSIAVFDPNAQEIRVRSYRIDDEASYEDPIANHAHDGVPVPTECFDTDWKGVGERVVHRTFGRR